ncbi:CsgE family curli-type amyloid fiber assembly protein [Adhaeribacter terreus]|uniref:Curli production assembly/transport component CsgE n=1 Tax=Adhaeribacter terreus TaxID=529703 RepID=A0ABW0EB27_9BACT
MLLPFCAFSQQNGSKIPPKTAPKQNPSKTKTQAAPVGKSGNTVKPKASENNKAQATNKNKKKAIQPAPDALKKIFEEVLKDKQQKAESALIFEIDGLLIDETLTKTGHDFYDIFYSSWEAPEQVNNYTVRIIERPLRGRGFQIIVAVNDVEIIEENLQPRYDMLEAAALNAVESTRGYLLNYENLKNQIDSDDQQGTGLF